MPLSPTISSLVWSTKPHIASALQAVDPSVLACMINAAFRLPHISLAYLYDQISEAQTRGTVLTGEQIQEEIIWRESSHAIDPHSALSTSSTFSPIGIPPTDSELFPPLVTSVQPGSVASFPLTLRHAESYLGRGAGARTVLVGDAAHSIHPLAGQGLNLGLGDVECLSRCIETAVLFGTDIGEFPKHHLEMGEFPSCSGARTCISADIGNRIVYGVRTVLSRTIYKKSYDDDHGGPITQHIQFWISP